MEKSDAQHEAYDPDDPNRKPFQIEIVWEDAGSVGRMRPRASLIVHRSLRTSGLLSSLSAEDLKSLIIVLSFIHPNGYCHATLSELCHWTGLPSGRMRSRLSRLTRPMWNGSPLLVEVRRESGLDAYTPVRELLDVTERIAPGQEEQRPTLRGVGKETLISRSREEYATPRAEVERQIADVNGWSSVNGENMHATDENTDLFKQITKIGVPEARARQLIAIHNAERILCQLEWLPQRNAISPARFLVAAIEGNYGPPSSLFRKHKSERITN